MPDIVQQNNPVLRQIATAVALEDIKSTKFKKVLRDMQSALHSQEDGVAIAAPQIAVPLRIFIVSGKIFDAAFFDEKTTEIKLPPAGGWPRDMVCINPKIVKRSKEKVWEEEGCLSVRWLYGKTHRHKNVTLEAVDEHGVKFTRGAGGLLAQIFQHETDHLDGILFIDTAKDVVDVPPETK